VSSAVISTENDECGESVGAMEIGAGICALDIGSNPSRLSRQAAKVRKTSQRDRTIWSLVSRRLTSAYRVKRFKF
jgi:hypothetical protein